MKEESYGNGKIRQRVMYINIVTRLTNDFRPVKRVEKFGHLNKKK